LVDFESDIRAFWILYRQNHALLVAEGFDGRTSTNVDRIAC
jgi:hypothetical protein